MAIAGLRGTGDWGPDERPKDFREMILWMEPNGQSPLTALMSKMSSEKLSDPEFSWWEEVLQHVRVSVNGALLAGDTGFTVDAAGGGPGNVSAGALALVAGDVLMVEAIGGAGELVLVVSDPASDTGITVSRGFGGTTPAAIADDAILLKVGTAFAEGSLSPKATSNNPTKFNNLVQIFKTSYSITETAKLTKARTGQLLQNEKKRKSFEHAKAMELAYIFGRKAEVVGPNGKPLRSTGGILSFLQSHVHTFVTGAGTDFTVDNLVDRVAPVFDYDAGGAGNERLVFCGNGALMELNKLIKSETNTRINFEGTVKVYGMELMKLVLPMGVLYFKTHPLFNTHPVYTYSMLGINPKGIKDRFLRKTAFKDNVQPNNADYVEGYWIAESGLELHFERTFFAMHDCRPH